MSEPGAFVIDLNRCTGCRACELACVIANRLDPGRSWRAVHDYNEHHVPGIEQFHLSLACNHCSEAPCLEQCPARAIRRDPATGAVLIDEQGCIGCGYCAWTCPWDAPRFDTARGVMTKCNFCHERQGEGREPACVTGCPTGALGWAEQRGSDPLPAVAGFADADTKPAVQLRPLADTRKLPEITDPPAMPPWREAAGRLLSGIGLAAEWPLAVFTFLLALLVGLFTASRLGAPSLDWRLFTGAGLAGLLLSAAHLGRKTMAWRAGLHVRRSWLSREVLCFGLFLACGAAVLATGNGLQWLGWAGILSGICAALSADMVYRVTRVRGSGPLHSALVLPTALLFAAAWGGMLRAALLISTLKLALYVARKVSRRNQGLGLRLPATLLRLSLLAAGSALLAAGAGPAGTGVFLLLALSELIDRLEYYDELEILTPESLMLDALKSRSEV